MGKHDGAVTLSTALDNGGLIKGLKSIKGSLGGLTKVVAKTAAVITTAFAAAAVVITKQAVAAYAEYEQLAGGIETLFKDSASKVKKYADDAFYTAGVSANKYMETVTSFSAGLISSLGGDTEKAADIANMAMIDMSDNANKMGSSLEGIQNAYQGFAKQNYTMLDNLKLGYGGTKTEMERLLADAQKLTGVKYNISNLSDVYTAIHVIQQNLDIAGTTAKEAEKTIAGAGNMTKSAWSNVLSAIAGGGDLDKAINNLVFSVSKYFENIVPVVERSLSGIGQLIEKIAPQLVQTVATALIKSIPSLLNAVYQMIIGTAQGIYQGIVALFKGGSVTTEISAQLNGVTDSASNAADATYDIADATEAAGKAAKKSLTGFDELNVLQAGSGGGSTGSAGVGAGVAAANVSAPVAVGGEVQDNISPKIEGLIQKIKGLGEQIATTFEPTIKSWGDAFSGLAPSIENTGSRIGTAWSNLWNNSLGPFGDYISTNFVPSIANTFSETFAPIFADVMPVAIDGFATNFDNTCLLIDECCTRLQTGFEGTKEVFSDMCDSMSTNWDEYGESIVQGSKEALDGVWDSFWGIFEQVIDPVLSVCADTFDWLWEKHLKPFWDDVVEFGMSLWDNILALWNGCLKPVIDWIVAFLAPVVVNAIGLIADWVGYSVALIVDVVGGIITFLDGIIQFVVGVFTLDWERAWGGIVKIFEGVFGVVGGYVKGVINSIIWAINALVAAVYSGIAGVVNGVGSIVQSFGELLGKDWGFSIPTTAPKIPYLAQGAVLPANKPFLAMVGDQKHGTNIEAPLETIKQAVAEVLTGYGAGAIEVENHISFTGDLAQLARVLKPAIDTETRRRGKSLVTGVY